MQSRKVNKSAEAMEESQDLGLDRMSEYAQCMKVLIGTIHDLKEVGVSQSVAVTVAQEAMDSFLNYRALIAAPQSLLGMIEDDQH
jgi:hypothetical protein